MVFVPKDSTLGVGPVITLIHQTPKYAFSAQFKWLPELLTDNRLNGNWFWFTVGLKF